MPWYHSSALSCYNINTVPQRAEPRVAQTHGTTVVDQSDVDSWVSPVIIATLGPGQGRGGSYNGKQPSINEIPLTYNYKLPK